MITINKKKFLTTCSQVEVYHLSFIHPEDGGRRILSDNPTRLHDITTVKVAVLHLTKSTAIAGVDTKLRKFASLLRGKTKQTK